MFRLLWSFAGGETLFPKVCCGRNAKRSFVNRPTKNFWRVVGAWITNSSKATNGNHSSRIYLEGKSMCAWKSNGFANGSGESIGCACRPFGI